MSISKHFEVLDKGCGRSVGATIQITKAVVTGAIDGDVEWRTEIGGESGFTIRI